MKGDLCLSIKYEQQRAMQWCKGLSFGCCSLQFRKTNRLRAQPIPAPECTTSAREIDAPNPEARAVAIDQM
jgi:hypothetical protein